MLSNLRKVSDNFIMRILLAMIVFAFVGWGIKDIIQTTHNFNLVVFSDIKNITEEEFLQAKENEINNIQKQMATNFNEEEIKQLNIDDIVIKKLINSRIINYLTNYYHLDLSDDTIIQLVRESPMFKNEHGMFNIKILNSYIKNSYINEDEYLLDIKEKTLNNVLINIFLETFQTPKSMIKNIVDYMATLRKVDIVQIDLNTQPKNLTIPSPTIEQLKDFYQDHKESFTIPEKRSFSYIKISSQNLSKKINFTKDELLKFYNDNKEEFNNKDFDVVKLQVQNMLKQQKLAQLNTEFAKNLEDDVASGLHITEIAKKYDTPLYNVDYISYEDLMNDKTGISEVTNSIFELTEGELSYPIELQDKSTLILVELESIHLSKTEEFSEIEKQVIKLWEKQYLSNYNLTIIENIAKTYNPHKVDFKNLASIGINVTPLVSLTRSEIEHNIQLPEELLLSIFQTKLNSSTPIFYLDGKAYFAYIRSITLDDTQAKTIETSSSENISITIKNCILDELINYIARKNKMKIYNHPN